MPNLEDLEKREENIKLALKPLKGVETMMKDLQGLMVKAENVCIETNTEGAILYGNVAKSISAINVVIGNCCPLIEISTDVGS